MISPFVFLRSAGLPHGQLPGEKKGGGEERSGISERERGLTSIVSVLLTPLMRTITICQFLTSAALGKRKKKRGKGRGGDGREGGVRHLGGRGEKRKRRKKCSPLGDRRLLFVSVSYFGRGRQRWRPKQPISSLL